MLLLEEIMVIRQIYIITALIWSVLPFLLLLTFPVVMQFSTSAPQREALLKGDNIAERRNLLSHLRVNVLLSF